MILIARKGWLMNTVVPDAWIIEEKIRRDRERQRKENEDNSLPISLPNMGEERPFDIDKSPRDKTTTSSVIIIDL